MIRDSLIVRYGRWTVLSCYGITEYGKFIDTVSRVAINTTYHNGYQLLTNITHTIIIIIKINPKPKQNFFLYNRLSITVIYSTHSILLSKPE